MKQMGIQAILIMNQAGLPLLFQKLDPKRSDIDPSLLSAFLTALKSFSLDLFEKEEGDFQVNYGKRLISLFTGQKTIFAIIHTVKSDDDLAQIINHILKEFENQYLSEIDIDDPGDLRQYQPFRERIAEEIGLSDPSLNWTPFLVKKPDAKSCEDNFTLQYINGEKTIQEIITASGKTKEEVLSALSKIWALGVLQFKDILDKKDVIIPTKNISAYLQSSSEEWQKLSDEFPKNAHMIPYIIRHLDGKTPVGTVLQQFMREGVEKVYDLLDYLFREGAVSILSPEKRRILMAKEILQKSLEIATQIYSKREALDTLKKTLQQFRKPEIISQIKVTLEKWDIDYSFLVYEGLSPEKVLELYETWLDLLRKFISSLGERNRRKYLETLTAKLDFDFFKKYRSEDMDGLEEFAFWLEQYFNY